jgi:ligand-binding sensor domain-containing protein
MRIIWIASLCCLYSLPGKAQHWSFQMYGTDQGLTNPTILALQQDRQGFLWVSTEGGLFRYDGDRFQPFAAKSATKHGNSNSIHSSADGQLWTGSNAGLFRWTGDDFAAVPGFEDVELMSGQAIGSDATNLYVAAPSGLRSMPLHGNRQPRMVSPKQSYSVFVASDQTVWFSCGLVLCSLKGAQEQEWAGDRGVTVGPWRSIVEDHAGRLWIRSPEKVLIRDSPGSPFHEVPNLPNLNSTHNAPLVTNRLGQVLIPHSAGLMICDSGQCRNFGVESGLLHAEVTSAIEDREGSLWLGYSGHGVARWLGREQWQSFAEEEGLANPSIWRIVRDGAGDLWIGTSRGLFHGTQTGGRWRFRPTDAVGEFSVYGLEAEADGSLWVGTFKGGANGLVRYAPRTHQRLIYSPLQSVPRFSVNAIDRDETGTVWVATAHGVMRLLPGARRLEFVPLPMGDAGISDVKSTHQGLFVASNKGLYIQLGQVHRWLTVADGLKDNWIQSVVIGPDGALWIAYFAPVGITRIEINRGNLRIRHFTTADGLPSDVVYSQFFDAGGRHWLGTDSGVAVLEGDRWIHYDTSDGLVWNDCNAHAYLPEPDGTVWVGTSSGLARFHTAALPKTILPEALITSVLRNDVPVHSTEFDSSTHSLALRFTMLSYKRREVQFRYRIGTESSPWMHTQTREVRFAELPPGSHRFEVQGEAEPGVWTHSAVLQFHISPPWFRTWQCQAGLLLALAGLFWWWWRQREIRQRTIRATLEAAVAERTRELHEQVRAKERARVELAEAQQHLIEVSRLSGMAEVATGVLHNVGNVLNSVNVSTTIVADKVNDLRVDKLVSAIDMLQLHEGDLTEFLSRDPKGRRVIPYLAKLAKHLHDERETSLQELDLLRVRVDHIKEIVAAQQNYGKVSGLTEKILLSDLVQEAFHIIQPSFERHNVRFEQDLEDIPAVNVDKQKILQILLNLLRNAKQAIKESSNEPRMVRVRIRRHGSGRVRIEVKDSGIGIVRENITRVFAHGFTTKKDGHGFGLHSGALDAKQMGGALWAESDGPGLGATFILELPLVHSQGSNVA